MKYTLSHIQAAYNLGKRTGRQEQENLQRWLENGKVKTWSLGDIKLEELEDRVWWNRCYRQRLDLFMEKLEEAALVKNKNEVWANVLKMRANIKDIPKDA